MAFSDRIQNIGQQAHASKMCNKIFVILQLFIYLFVTVNCKLAQEDTEEVTECDIKPENTPLSCEKELVKNMHMTCDDLLSFSFLI